MKRITAAALLALPAAFLLAQPGFAQSVGEKTGVNALVGISPTTEDFVKEAAVSGLFEIQSSELAGQKAIDPPTKAFADHMVKDHTKVSSELKALVASGKVKAEIPAQLDSSHQSTLDKLKGLDGADFAKEYRSDQQSGHKDAVSLFKRYADGGDNAELKAFAAKTLPELQGHLDEAQQLDQLAPTKRPATND